MKHVGYLINATGIVAMLGGKHYTVSSDHPNYNRIKDALVSKQYDLLTDLFDVRASVKRWLSHDRAFTLTNDLVALNGVPFGNAVSEKVLNMIEAGHDAEPLFSFLRKVRQNPSNIAQNELLLFCVANGFMIHTDGDIIAYKSVREDYTDIHSGKFMNTVGTVNLMSRGAVDDVRSNTCSRGLHFASFEYASTWAGSQARHLMVMKINPMDVVSIPEDYDNQKGRCCRYEVIAECDDFKPLPKQEVYDFGFTPEQDFGNEDESDADGEGYDEGYEAGRLDAQGCEEPEYDGSGVADDYEQGYCDGFNDTLDKRRI